MNKKSIIELGAGTGLVSILIDKIFTCESIVVTDLNSHIPLIKRNIALNDANCCTAFPFDWCKDDLGTFDIVLVLECVYSESLYEALVGSFDRLCTEKTIVFLGLTRLFAKPFFFSLLKRRGYLYTLIPENFMPPTYCDDNTNRDIGLLVVRRDSRYHSSSPGSSSSPSFSAPVASFPSTSEMKKLSKFHEKLRHFILQMSSTNTIMNFWKQNKGDMVMLQRHVVCTVLEANSLGCIFSEKWLKTLLTAIAKELEKEGTFDLDDDFAQLLIDGQTKGWEELQELEHMDKDDDVGYVVYDWDELQAPVLIRVVRNHNEVGTRIWEVLLYFIFLLQLLFIF